MLIRQEVEAAMRAVLSRHPVLILFCVLTVSVLGGGLLAGCGSSSSTASGGGTIQTPGEPNQGTEGREGNDQGPGDQSSDDQESGDQRSGDQEAVDQRGDRPMDPNVSARGRVIYPDTTVVPNAQVYADPTVGETVRTDSMGWFEFNESFPEGEYTFNAIDLKEGREGKTTVRVGGGDRIQKTVWIVVGVGEKSLEAISIDSVRANPGGPGLKRTGN